MNQTAEARLFGWRLAFDDSGAVFLLCVLAALLILAAAAIVFLAARGKIDAALRTEIIKRYLTWLIIILCVVVPVMAGAAWTILLITTLSVWCFFEFARATGFLAERRLCVAVVISILWINFAAIDHWYAFFVALVPLSMVLIAALAVSVDQPQGFIRRLGIAVLCMLLFGSCLGHLSFMANAANYRALLLLLFFCVGLNDVFAFCVGKAIGGPKLAPNTSPNKTCAGALGALLLTSITFALLGRYVFSGTPMQTWKHLLILGALLSIAGQFGDLTLSSVKRDLGVKDTGNILPGHGGILDRANSLLFAAPVMFHYVHYIMGIGLNEPARIFTGG